MKVTRLKCGGFVFAMRMNHTMFDAVGLAQFLNAVGEIARGAHAPSIPLIWERELLNARELPQVTYMHHEGSVIASMDQSDLVQRCFYFGPMEIRAARKHLPPNLSNTCSTFEFITGYLWKCRTIALAMYPNEVVHRKNLNVPLGFYGNAIGFPGVVSTAELLSGTKSVNLISFYVRDSNQEKDYGILVPMCLPFWCLEKIEQQLKRITMEPVVIPKQDSNTCPGA
ncbi:methanol O-anthraniloyltransferase-like [Pyrus ussuriensis x Pyrus communis]|uniref:Methanol O-anthraniloyltransferase-like n=1 Tax=Pyrus ussuriensis x Pyrus communis TaxID=2448454 RepID=A0A5N5G701_9ROSA|nr:methanol O-anthraniloyltransferase-like [Pyrus ussuriensis x Pyrus communis]